ncbi:MAG: hypothetical protein H6701_02200 [Myxococcales bacterium]|nr:hypothetical protein [Myxococcales bacterium]
MMRSIAVVLLVPSLAVGAPLPPCADEVGKGADLPCQLVLDAGARAPFRGVLLSPAQSKAVQADIATLEAAYAEQQALTAQARGERDAAREESRGVIVGLLETGQRLERANAELVGAQARLDASNRALADAVEAMPTRLTLMLAGVLVAGLAFGGGYALGRLVD